MLPGGHGAFYRTVGLALRKQYCLVAEQHLSPFQSVLIISVSSNFDVLMGIYHSYLHVCGPALTIRCFTVRVRVRVRVSKNKYLFLLWCSQPFLAVLFKRNRQN